ncbi:MAG: CPBP family intramembrane metalloprotease [Flavobacteriaceae bacterium]
MSTAINQMSKKSLITKVLLAWFLGLIALALANWLSAISFEKWGLGNQEKSIIQAIIFVGLVIPCIWLLRIYLDKGTPKTIGLGNFKHSISKFGLGMGLLIIPITITITCTTLFGWGEVHFNMDNSILSSFFIGFIITFLYEALPEELIFRGYIYSNLAIKYRRWVSALITIGLFALLPIILVQIQKHILGIEVQIGNSQSIQVSYIITMIIFGAFVQYLRMLTNSIWTGIGFHLMFVYVNWLIGTESTNLIQFSNFTNETPVQITFIITLLTLFIALLMYPKLTKRKIGWNQVDN